MQTYEETRRYLAKVSRIGIVVATVYALVYGMLHFFLMPSKYADGFQLSSLFIGQHNVFPEITVTAVGVLALAVCGILSLTLRGKPTVAERAWIAAGKITLLAAPVGYIQSLCGMTHLLTAVSSQTEFLFSFAALAAVFVGYALAARGISVDQRFLNADRTTYVRRVLRNTAVVCGIMLAAILLMLGRTWMKYGAVLQTSTMLTFLLWDPLKASAPVALAVMLGYPLLSFAARWDNAPRKGLLGKGTILLCWVTLAVSTCYQIIALLIQTRGLDYTADGLMGGLTGLQELQAMQKVISTLATLLGIWTLCRILSRVRESRTALWGARGLLGVVVLRNLSLWILGVIATVIQLRRQSDASTGIIGGADYSLTVLTAKMQSWANVLFTVLSIAALVVLTIGLTRHYRVGKAFWTVPILTAAGILISLTVSIVSELVMRNMNTDSALSVITVTTAFTAVRILLRSLVGILALTRAPAEEAPPPPATPDGEEPPKPRVEDYLYQL